jgi:hypothetical protein
MDKDKRPPIVYCKENKLGKVIWFIDVGGKNKPISADKAHVLAKAGKALEVPYFLYRNHRQYSGIYYG